MADDAPSNSSAQANARVWVCAIGRPALVENHRAWGTRAGIKAIRPGVGAEQGEAFARRGQLMPQAP